MHITFDFSQIYIKQKMGRPLMINNNNNNSFIYSISLSYHMICLEDGLYEEAPHENVGRW